MNPTPPFPPPSPEPPFRQVFPWVLLVSGMFLLSYLSRAMFGPLLPFIEQEFSLSHSASTSLLFYTAIGYSTSTFLSGFSSSKVRPRILVGGSLLGSGAVLLALAAAHSYTVLAVLFAALGLVGGQYFNGGLSTLRSLVRPRQWSKAIAVHELGPNGSFIFAPLLAELGAGWMGWRGVVSGMGWLSILAGVVFLIIAKGGESPAAPVSFKGVGQALKNPRLWLLTWLIGLGIAGEFGPFSVLTLHMIDERGFAPDSAAFLLSITRVAAPFAVLAGGFITARFGTRRTLIFCLLAFAAGMFLLAMPQTGAFIAGMFIQPVLTAMLFPPIFTFLAESFALRDQPLILSLSMPVASFVGLGLIPPLLGLWGDHVSFSAGFVMMGCMVAAILPVLFRLKEEKSPFPED